MILVGQVAVVLVVFHGPIVSLVVVQVVQVAVVEYVVVVVVGYVVVLG